MSTVHARPTPEDLARAATNVRWWPPAMAFILLGIAYALVSDRLTVGPRWALLVVVILAVAGAGVLRGRGLIRATRWLIIGALAAGTAALTGSAAFLVGALLDHS